MARWLTFANMDTPKDIYKLELPLIQGGVLPLRTLAGKPVLIVNVASECGYTPQYRQLQELHEWAGDRLAVIGFPCNDFGGQEPGDADAIHRFCTSVYGVTFPITQKVHILSSPRHPVYDWLCTKALNGVSDAEVTWNFTKFVLSKAGHWVGCFGPAVSPLDEDLLHALNLELPL